MQHISEAGGGCCYYPNLYKEFKLGEIKYFVQAYKLCMSHNKDLNSRMCDFKICTLKCYTVLHWHVLRTTTGKKSGSNKEACTY